MGKPRKTEEERAQLIVETLVRYITAKLANSDWGFEEANAKDDLVTLIARELRP